MKIPGFQRTAFTLSAAIIAAISTANIFGQTTIQTPTPMFHDVTPSSDTAPATVTAPPATTALPPAAAQVLQLAQAKISDSTIVTFVQNSGSVYGLNASQVVYLKQQGVSDAVLNAMLNQRTMLASAATLSMPDNASQNATMAPTTVAQPATPAPSSVYVVPDSQTYYYDSWAYPYYYPSYYPYYYSWPVGVYWGGGWRGGFHGGGFGGFHGGGGGFHVGGGGFHGGFSGGFHGGGGGFHR